MGVGGGPSLSQAQNTMTTSVTKTRPSVRSSRSFHLPFASAFGAGGGNNPAQQQPAHAHGAMSSLSNRTTKSGKLYRLFYGYHSKLLNCPKLLNPCPKICCPNLTPLFQFGSSRIQFGWMWRYLMDKKMAHFLFKPKLVISSLFSSRYFFLLTKLLQQN